MATETEKFESAQALFCAIADKVGSSNIDKVLNIETYKTYSDFVLGNQQFIDAVFNGNSLDVDVSRKEIEQFLLKQKSWYISSVKIAKKLLKDLAKEVDKDFKDITKAGFQRNYLRGDKSVVQKITELYNLANNNTKYNQEVMKIPKFGDINKWSPADIYYASNKVKNDITPHLGKAQKDKTYSFDKLNLFISKKIDSGDLLPLSLKKATTSVVIKKVNFDIDFRTKLIDGIAKSGKVEGGLWHAKNQKTSTGFQSWQMYPKDGLKREKLSKATGIPAQYGEPINKQELDKQPSSSFYVAVSNNSSRGSSIGYIQHRHDRSGASWKVDFNYTVGEARGGSVVSHKLFADLLAFADPTVSTEFLRAYEDGNKKYKEAVRELKKYRADIETLNKNRKENPNKYGKTLFPGKKPTHFDNVRGQLSSLLVTNRVNKILQDWFNKNSKVSGDEPNKVDMFIRILYRYVTSRSETSAKFVIAKS